MLHRTASFRCAASRLLTTSRSQSAAAGSLSVLAGHSRCSAISANASAASAAATGDSWNVSSCATGRRWFSSVPAELSDILTRELAEEESNASATMPDDLSELKSQIEESGWRIVDGSSGLDAGSGSTIKLFKKDPLEGSGAKVAVAFHCQDTIPTEEEEEGGGFFGEDDGDEEEEDAVAARFTVLVSRAGRTMVYTCISEEATVNVERVCMVDGDDIESLINDGIDEKSYQGPEFSELAEDLQQSLGSYVDEVCGVDSDVAAFVSMYADYKEQCEYVAWLKSVKSML
mmetsp:Transcript_34056/g.68630  ORF Transcript_34056/g.68630 Transcript_34056/m.68630 type:complete len:288 (+) Transcript_34056:554-1417(+)